MIKSALFTLVTADAVVQAAIGDRFYASRIPKQAWNGTRVQPCAVYQRIGRQSGVGYCGTDGLTRSTFQVDTYGLKPEDAAAVADALKSALVDFRGEVAGVSIRHIALETEFDLDDPEPGVDRVSMTFTVWHSPD